MKIEIEQITVDKTQVLKFLGYGKKQPVPIIDKKINEEIEEAYDLFRPYALIQPFSIDYISDSEIAFDGQYRIKSEYVANELKDSSSLYVLLYTIGDRIQTKIDEYGSNSEMIRAMILDKVGVVALDNVRDQVQAEIMRQISPLKISTRLFPSQKDFAISNQPLFIDIFQKENDIITISKYNQFHPIKTVACLFGVGKEEDLSHMCDHCEQKCH